VSSEGKITSGVLERPAEGGCTALTSSRWRTKRRGEMKEEWGIIRDLLSRRKGTKRKIRPERRKKTAGRPRRTGSEMKAIRGVRETCQKRDSKHGTQGRRSGGADKKGGGAKEGKGRRSWALPDRRSGRQGTNTIRRRAEENSATAGVWLRRPPG